VRPDGGCHRANPVGIGYETVKAAVAAAKDEAVEKNIDTGFYYYDKSNIDAGNRRRSYVDDTPGANLTPGSRKQ
jgi:ABC-type sugar transport system substrate-binding protein